MSAQESSESQSKGTPAISPPGASRPAEPSKIPASFSAKFWRLAEYGMVVLAFWLLSRFTGGATNNVIPPGFTPIEKTDVDAEEIYYCGRTEKLTDNITTKPWPVRRLPWTVNVSGFKGALVKEQIIEAFRVAWASYAAEIDIEPVFTDNEREALILSRFQAIDGSGKVLAWSELANGQTTQKHQAYDSGERWEVSQNPTQKIDLVRVAAHEIGHVLGLTHDTEDSGALLAPMYSRSVRYPTERDIKRLLALGYKVKRKGEDIPVPPTPVPNPSPSISIKIEPSEIIRALRESGYKVEYPSKS